MSKFLFAIGSKHLRRKSETSGKLIVRVFCWYESCFITHMGMSVCRWSWGIWLVVGHILQEGKILLVLNVALSQSWFSVHMSVCVGLPPVTSALLHKPMLKRFVGKYLFFMIWWLSFASKYYIFSPTYKWRGQCWEATSGWNVNLCITHHNKVSVCPNSIWFIRNRHVNWKATVAKQFLNQGNIRKTFGHVCGFMCSCNQNTFSGNV